MAENALVMQVTGGLQRPVEMLLGFPLFSEAVRNIKGLEKPLRLLVGERI